MSIEISEAEDGLYIISIIDSDLENAEKLKKKILKELNLKPIHTSITIEIQVLARKKPRRKTINIIHV